MKESDDFVEDDFAPDTDDFEEDDFTEDETPDRGLLEKGARIAGQYGLGVLEGTPSAIAYDVAVAPLASKEAQTAEYRKNLFEDIERLQEQKQTGVWSEKDQKLYDNLIEQAKDASKSEEFIKTADLSVRGLIEKATGIDLKPEGVAEKAAQWAGFMKDPKKLFELAKTGLNPKAVIKALSPSGKEALQGIGAGTALEMAEQGGFGPLGTLVAAVVGDIGGRFVSGAAKKSAKILTNPKQALAEVASVFTGKDKLDLQKQIIKDFRDANVQADIGTITNSDFMKWVQSRLAQSGLTGDALDKLKKTVTKQIEGEYKSIADSLGESKFSNNYEAGQATKQFIKETRDKNLDEIRETYKKANESIKKDAHVPSKRLAAKIAEIEESLKPGQIKSAEQNVVLENLAKIKREIYDSEGKLLQGKVKNLINDKIALNDIINYEVQGGTKQLLKGLVQELDRAIISHGKDNPSFAKNYIKANKEFSQHAKTFRNKRISKILSDADPAQLMTNMNSVHGIKTLNEILSKTTQGKELMENLKRFRLDKMVTDNFVDSITEQLKLGKFSKFLEKEKNSEIISKLLPSDSLKRLKNLQKNSGRLAESAQKFLNASKSGVTREDAGIIFKVLWDISHLLTGNPWPLLKTGAGITGARYVTKLMGDPEFLRLVEDFVLASEKNNTSSMEKIAKQMIPLVRVAQNKEE